MSNDTISQPTDADVQDFIAAAAVEMTDGARRYNDFLASLSQQMNKGKALSPKQLDAGRRFLIKDREFAAKREAEAADRTDAPLNAKSFVVTGEIVSVKYKTGDFGTQLKMTVRDDKGFMVWGTCPASIANTVDYDDEQTLVGLRVQFMAAIKQSDTDSTFGFFSRPSAAKVLHPGA